MASEPSASKSLSERMKSFQGIFGLVLLFVSIIGLILVFVLPWYSYEEKFETDRDLPDNLFGDPAHPSVSIPDGAGTVTLKDSYKYGELDSDNVGSHLNNGAIYVLVGFIVLLIFSLVNLIGIFSDFLHRPLSMMLFGLGAGEDITRTHLRNLGSIGAMLMWFPVLLITYGSARFVGAVHMVNSNFKDIWKLWHFTNISGDTSTVSGYLFFFLGIFLFLGLIYYLYRTWLKLAAMRSKRNAGPFPVNRAGWVMIGVILLLTLALVFMPVYSMSKEKWRVDEEKVEIYHSDGYFHNILDAMEERGEVATSWEDVSDDLSMMQWALFGGIALSLLTLIGLSVYLANPRFKIGPLLQWSSLLAVIAGIVFLIGHIMLWTDLGDLSPSVSTGMWEQEFSFGNNYLPFIFSVPALAGAGYASFLFIPLSVAALKGEETAVEALTGEALVPVEEETGKGPGFPARVVKGLKRRKRPIIVSLSIVGVIIAAIVVYSVIVNAGEDEGGSTESGPVEFDETKFDLTEGAPETYYDYALEGEETKIYYYIEETNVSAVRFRLTWEDEEEQGWIGSAPNRENEPDQFTLEVSSPHGNITAEESAANPRDEMGIIELNLDVPVELVPSYQGTGTWNVTITVDAGDHEPKYGGATRFLDNGNEFILEISYDHYVEKSE